MSEGGIGGGASKTEGKESGGGLSINEILEIAREEAEDVRGRLAEGRGIADAISKYSAELAAERAKMRQEIQSELDAAERKLQRDSAEAETRAAKIVAEAEQRVGEAKRTAAAILAEADGRARAAAASERARVEAYLQREDQIEARRRAVQTFARAAANQRVVLDVRGTKFRTDLNTLCGSFSDNVLAQTVTSEGTQDPDDKSYYVNGDPTHFHFVLNFLSDGDLPAEASTSELKWLEREAKRYHLHELAELCQHAHSRLNVPRILELLNFPAKNFSGMNMRALVLTGMDFSGASLHHVNLADAVLRHICAKKATLRGADLSRADLEGADLTGADLRGCNLTNAKLTGTTLTDADLRGANLHGAVLQTLTSVRGAQFEQATLAQCSHGVAELRATGFRFAQLKAGGFSLADMTALGFSPFWGTLFDENGVLYQIGTAGGTREYQNPHQSGDVQVSTSSGARHQDASSSGFAFGSPSPGQAREMHGKIEHFVAHSATGAAELGNYENNWFMVDLKEHRRLQVTHYCLRHGVEDGHARLQKWRLEGSNDGSNWTTLRDHNNDNWTIPHRAYSEAGWAVDGCDPGGYRFLRIFNNGITDNALVGRRNFRFRCAGIEFYGVLSSPNFHFGQPPWGPAIEFRFGF